MTRPDVAVAFDALETVLEHNSSLEVEVHEQRKLLRDAHKALSLIRSAVTGSDVRQFDQQFVDGVERRLRAALYEPPCE